MWRHYIDSTGGAYDVAGASTDVIQEAAKDALAAQQQRQAECRHPHSDLVDARTGERRCAACGLPRPKGAP